METNDKIREVQDKFLSGCWEKVRDYYYEPLKDKNVIIYGSGIYGRFLYEAVCRIGLKDNIKWFINDFVESSGTELFGVAVDRYGNIDINKDSDIVLIGIQNNKGIIERLEADGVNYIYSDYDECFFEDNLMYTEFKCIASSPISDLCKKINDYYELYCDKIQGYREYFDEDVSLRILEDRENLYKTGDVKYIDDLPVNPRQYFEADYYNISDNEVYVDCGAFDGDSIREFNEYTNGKYEEIYAFEPDEISFRLLEKTVENLHNVTLFPYATGEEEGEAFFNSTGTLGASIADKGNAIQIKTLDGLLKDKRVSLIKMDIEGAELDTLKGAEEIIKTYKPKLAVCIYHKLEDIITIPQYIKSIVPEYKFKVRQHSRSMLETVLYAEV